MISASHYTVLQEDLEVGLGLEKNTNLTSNFGTGLKVTNFLDERR
jgi:hypothetical protein